MQTVTNKKKKINKKYEGRTTRARGILSNFRTERPQGTMNFNRFHWPSPPPPPHANNP